MAVHRHALRCTVLTLTLMVAGSGCATPAEEPEVASAGSSAPAAAAADDPEQAYGECLQDAGVTMLPDVDGPPQVDKEATPESTLLAATEECRLLAPVATAPEPVSAADLEQRRLFSACLRDNGVPDYPDPDPQTGEAALSEELAMRLKGDAAFAQAQEACRDILPPPVESDVSGGG
jgi:hypothetical protein